MDTTTQEVEEVQIQTTEVVESTEATQTAVVPETPVAPQQVSFEDGLKGFGLTKDDLEKIQAEREAKKAEDEKPLQEQTEWAEKVKYGISQKLITKEDLDKHTILSKKDDMALVYENFEFDNTENLEGVELEDAKKEAFNDIYNLNAQNAKAKAKAEMLLKADAEKIRNEIGEKISKVNSEFEENKISSNFFNDRQNILKELNEKGFTETIEIDGKPVELNIPVKTTEAEIKEMLTSEEGIPILKLMRDVYKDNKDGAKQLFKELIVSNAKTKAIYEAGLEAGKKANYGATAPFNSKETTQPKGKDSPEDAQKQQARRASAGIV